jgi:hypothetical protein
VAVEIERDPQTVGELVRFWRTQRRLTQMELALSRLLEAHEPNPALIVDGLWNLIEANRAASLRACMSTMKEGAIRRHGERAVPRWVDDDVRHRSKASGSFAGSRLVKDPVIRKAAFRFQCARCGRCA